MWPALIIFGAWTALDYGLMALTGKDSVDYVLDWAGIGVVPEVPVPPDVPGLPDVVISYGSSVLEFLSTYSVALVTITFLALAGLYVATRPLKKSKINGGR